MTTLCLRPARPEDAGDLARLMNTAGEGMPLAVWRDMAGPGADPWAFGRSRAARGQGAFSWRNARLAEIDHEVAAGVLSYLLGDDPVSPDPLPPAFRPLQALENRAPGTVYVNMLATFAPHRRHGLGRALLEGVAPGPAGRSVIVGDRNRAAQALYRAAGFAEIARAPALGGFGWQPPHREWLLLVAPR